MGNEIQNVREALMAQLLGDVDALVKQIESVSTSIGQTYDGAIERLAEHEKKVACLIMREADKGTRNLTAALREDYAEARRSAGAIAHKAEKAALLIDRAAWRLYVMSLVGGVVGGLAAVAGYITLVTYIR